MGIETCGPNEVLVVSGAGHSVPKYKIGGWVFVWPKLQKVQRLSLSLITLKIETLDALTEQGVDVSVKAVAQVKIYSGNNELLRAAAENFLGKSEEELRNVVKATLEGLQKTLIGSMSLEEIYFDRNKKFNKALFELASSDLINMGIQIVSYRVTDVTANEELLAALVQKQEGETSGEVKQSTE